MKPFHYLIIIPILTTFSGCSGYIKSQLGKSLTSDLDNSSSSVFQGEEDPVLLGDALPFMIKMLEVMVTSSPENPDLKAAAAKTMLAYGKVWLEYDAALLEEDHYEKAEVLKYRAKRLYFRAKEMGLKGIQQKYPDFFETFVISQTKALSMFQSDDVPLLTGTGLSWVLWISNSTQSPTALANLPKAIALLNRALELNPDYENGQLHEFFIQYYAEQGIQNPENKLKIQKHWTALQELSHGRLCSPYLTWATAISVKTQNKKEFEAMLKKALEIDPLKYPNVRLSNELCRRDAKLNKKRIEDLFF